MRRRIALRSGRPPRSRVAAPASAADGRGQRGNRRADVGQAGGQRSRRATRSRWTFAGTTQAHNVQSDQPELDDAVRRSAGAARLRSHAGPYTYVCQLHEVR